MDMRIGSGHDSHRLIPGRRLVLGGVDIPFTHGLDGHSDADVVLHALTDALLGTLSLGDIGDCYPNTDPKYYNQDSRLFVAETLAKLAQAGWAVVNIDVTIFAEVPKFGLAKQDINASLATLLGLPPDRVSVKAKTGEGVGHIGRGEAIGCHAVVLVAKGNLTP